MKKQAIELHKIYAAKVSGNVVPVRLDKESPHGGWLGVNMATRKEVRIKSAQRLRGLWPKKNLPIVAEKDGGKAGDQGVAETVAAVEKGNLAEGVTVPEATKRRKVTKDTTGQPGRDGGEPAATGAKPERHSLLNLAARVLAEASEPMNCQQMVDKVLATGLWQTKGRTPAATLYSAVIREIATKGEAARFRKVDKGKFAAVTH
jgi:hypothetical protein